MDSDEDVPNFPPPPLSLIDNPTPKTPSRKRRAPPPPMSTSSISSGEAATAGQPDHSQTPPLDQANDKADNLNVDEALLDVVTKDSKWPSVKTVRSKVPPPIKPKPSFLHNSSYRKPPVLDLDSSEEELPDFVPINTPMHNPSPPPTNTPMNPPSPSNTSMQPPPLPPPNFVPLPPPTKTPMYPPPPPPKPEFYYQTQKSFHDEELNRRQTTQELLQDSQALTFSEYMSMQLAGCCRKGSASLSADDYDLPPAIIRPRASSLESCHSCSTAASSFNGEDGPSLAPACAKVACAHCHIRSCRQQTDCQCSSCCLPALCRDQSCSLKEVCRCKSCSLEEKDVHGYTRWLVVGLALLLFVLLSVGLGVGLPKAVELKVEQRDKMVVLMVGGNDGGNQASVEIVTESGGCPNHDIPPLPEGRRGGAVGVVVHTQELVNGTLEQVEVLMFCGGLIGKMEKGDCWTLDFSLMKWNTAPSLLQATAFPAYSSVKERFYVVGGYNSGNALDHLQIYSEGQWQLGNPLPSRRYGGCGQAYLNYLVVAGGWVRDVNMVTQKEIFVYSVRSRKWKKVSTPSGYTGRATHSCVTMTYKNTSAIALVGGLSNQLNKTITRPWRIDMMLLNKTGVTWGHEVTQPVGAWQPAVGVAPEGDLVVAGGRNTDDRVQIGQVRGWRPGRNNWEHLGNLTTARDQAAVLQLDIKWAWLARKCRIDL